MLASMILAASMLMVSDRDNFWDTEKVSLKTEFGWVDEQGVTKLLKDQEVNNTLADLKGKRVLVLVHGFDTVQPSSYYFDIKVNLEDQSIDQVIGYLWPCYDDEWEYFYAKESTQHVKRRLRDFLTQLGQTAANVDVLAHSMGNHLMLETLNYPKTPTIPNLVNNFYLFAPAVNDVSIYQDQTYFNATKNCDDLYVFYSKNDTTLKWYYLLAEWHEALGYEGDSDPVHLPPNIQMIDCTSIVDTHSAYLFALPLYSYIQQIKAGAHLTPYYAQDVTMNTDGNFTVNLWRNHETGSNP